MVVRLRTREKSFVACRALLGALFLTASCAQGFALPPGSVSEEFVAANWRVEHGLPENNVNGVLQTRDGYLWIATWNGLARFDGVRFVRFGLSDGLKTTATYLLHEDRQGNLWVGTYDGGVSLYRDGQFRSFTRSEVLPSDNVGSLTEDRAGNLWGLSWGRGALGRTPFPDRVARRPCDEQPLWVGTEGGGLHRIESGRTVLSLTTRDGLPVNSIRCLQRDAEGTLWMGTFGGGLVRYRDEKLASFGTSQGLPDGPISAILEDADGRLWCAATVGFFCLGKRALDDVAAGRAKSAHPLLVGVSAAPPPPGAAG